MVQTAGNARMKAAAVAKEKRLQAAEARMLTSYTLPHSPISNRSIAPVAQLLTQCRTELNGLAVDCSTDTYNLSTSLLRFIIILCLI